MSWTEAESELWKLGLVLPTEARWEYATLLGDDRIWWTGSDRESLKGAANIADKTAADFGARWPGILAWPEFEDGYLATAPVGSLLPNPNGLHHVHGNVWEWCLDKYQNYTEALSADGSIRKGDGLHLSRDTAYLVCRGGSYADTSDHARGLNRNRIEPQYVSGNLGLRAARDVDGLRQDVDNE